MMQCQIIEGSDEMYMIGDIFDCFIYANSMNIILAIVNKIPVCHLPVTNFS